MTYPSGVITRQVSFGGASAVESGEPLKIQVTTKSSRSLIWRDSGYRLESLEHTLTTETPGEEVFFEIPVTDQNGWNDAETRQAIIVNPGESSHTYTSTLCVYNGQRMVRAYVIGPYPVANEPGVLDGDLISTEVDPIDGTLTVYIPGPSGDVTPEAEEAATRAEDARDQAEVFAAGTVTLQDTAVAQLITTPGSETQTQLNATFADKAALGGLVAPPLTNITETERGASPRVLDSWGGFTWGTTNDDIYRSDDAAETWELVNTNFPGVVLTRLLPTADGEVLAMANKTIHKSSGWGTGSVSWTLKVTANASAYFLEWSLDGDGQKFITTEYSSTRADSRYARISLDGGNTFTVAYDSNTLHGAVGVGSHLHGCAYDQYSDRFYVSEGHDDAGSVGDIAGLWCSADDGATWTRADGMAKNPSPTVIVSTPSGLVCGSDSTDNGLFGVARRDNPDDEQLVQTWRWVTGRAGLVGFARRGFEQPGTGVVYISFTSNYADVAPIIAAGTPTSGALVYTWPSLPVTANDFISNVVFADREKLIAAAMINGSGRVITAEASRPGAGGVLDTGNAVQGSAINGSSLALGHGSTTGAAQRGLAIGPAADASVVQDVTAVGSSAKGTGQSATALGSGAEAGATGVAVGQVATAVGEGTAVGASAQATGSGGTVLGRSAVAGAASVAIGRGASVSESNGIAIGFGAQGRSQSVVVGQGAQIPAGHVQAVAVGGGASAQLGGVALGVGASAFGSSVALGRLAQTTATQGVAVGREAASNHARSVALGYQTVTSATDQLALGGRHVEVDMLAGDPAAPGAGKFRIYGKDVGGKVALFVRFPTGAVQQIAIEP